MVDQQFLEEAEPLVSASHLAGTVRLMDFWTFTPDQRRDILQKAIAEAHIWHFERNLAYRNTVAARGVGPMIHPEDLPLLLRPTAQTFKSYIDILGTPFPSDCPRVFLDWLADQLSIQIPRQRVDQLRSRYGSLETLLSDCERIFADFGLEISTSSGTSGRSTIMVRDQDSINKTVESFYLAFQRYFEMQADHRAVFIMPRKARIAMVRMASFSVKRVGIPDDHIHFTIPFPAAPDMVRIRAGRTYRPGLQGRIERRLLNPFMTWMNEHYVNPQAVQRTIKLMKGVQSRGEKLLLFGGWVQLHAVALELQRTGQVIRLAPGSLLGSGGGLKERYTTPLPAIRADLRRVITLTNGDLLPIKDTYGMAEGNWAAMQCSSANYHIPPWIYAVTLDENGSFISKHDSEGLLAFYDPFGGGKLFPAFFRTADRVRLVNSDSVDYPAQACPCGESGAYIAQDSIQRVDLIEEAGCAAQM
jgi:hypothetical protein